MSEIRLQKYIADCGITSRRKAEDLILQGKVKVNGNICVKLGTKVDTTEDVVMVNDEVIDREAVDHLYLVLNKPRSYVTTMNDPEGRRTVMDLVPINTRVFPVGRLDYLSEGLLLLTNDGDIANKIIHPRFNVTKTYEVKVFGKVNEAILKKLKAGVTAHDGVLKPKSVRVIEQLPNKTWLEFRLNEGKNREIRRICEACGVTIDKLKRVAIGGLAIDGVAPGKWNYISKSDLLKFIGIKADGTALNGGTEYISPKKSINIRKGSKIQKETTLADSKEFTKFRKEIYFETIRGLNARKNTETTSSPATK
tara:strand:- start:67945 stop:68871 length:927 start_codon:yes stop_codon:yes gene_type:complete